VELHLGRLDGVERQGEDRLAGHRGKPDDAGGVQLVGEDLLATGLGMDADQRHLHRRVDQPLPRQRLQVVPVGV
jgi:hypothetical protein